MEKMPRRSYHAKVACRVLAHLHWQYGFHSRSLSPFQVLMRRIDEPSEKELNRVCTEVTKFKLAAHFYWGLWALIQANLSDIDFDYMGYAVKVSLKHDIEKLALMLDGNRFYASASIGSSAMMRSHCRMNKVYIVSRFCRPSLMAIAHPIQL